MSSLDELELSQKLCGPLHIVFRVVWNGEIDRLDDALGIILQILASVHPLISTLGTVAGADRAEETVEETPSDALSRVFRMDEEFHLHSEAIHTALVAVVFHRCEPDNSLLNVVLAASGLVAFGDCNDVGQLLAGDFVHTVHDVIDLAKLEFWGADAVFDVVVVNILNNVSYPQSQILSKILTRMPAASAATTGRK